MLGVFDSGSGGLTVLRALLEQNPQIAVTYFGDIAHAPYGNKNREELSERVQAGISLLKENGCTEFLLACNSVADSVTDEVLTTLSIPETSVVTMIGPAARAVCTDYQGSIALVATVATITSGSYQRACEVYGKTVTPCALPSLVPELERGASREELRQLLRTDLAQLEHEHDVMLLGCTHFPLIIDLFQEIIEERCWKTPLVDPAHAVAQEALSRFTSRLPLTHGQIRFITSKESEVFQKRVAEIFPHIDYTLEVE